MDYLIYQTKELEALNGLPHIQQLIYFAAIRPFIDFSTGIAGVRRRISHQSIKEAISVDPGPGIKSRSPSREQIRRAVISLERIGLIIIQSDESHLILKCPLAIAHKFVQNKTDSIPTPQTDTPKIKNNVDTAKVSEIKKTETDIFESQETDTLHYSNNNKYFIFLREQFEKFWTRYPRKNGKENAWNMLKNLQPDESVFTQIVSALETQLLAEKQQKAHGIWVPNWKNAANWLAQRCWEDEIDFDWIKEQTHAKSSAINTKSPADDWYWESCKTGADYDFDSEPTAESANTKVIDINHFRR